MATQDLLPGNRFRLYRKADSGSTYAFVCLATTITFTRTNELQDATTVDCDDPTGMANESNIKTRRSWAINFSGKTDPKKLELIEADYAAEPSRSYQLLTDRNAAGGGKTYTGNAHISQLEIGRPENGMVTFSVQMRGDGPLVTAPVT